MKCPKCNLIHPDTATKCVCSYEFVKSDPVLGVPNVDTMDSDSRLTNNPFAPPEINHSDSGLKNFRFHGNGMDLFSIYIVNVLLIFLTLGVYYFWGKVKIKRYLYSQTEFNGDRFSFHGTGFELFRGGIIGIVFLILLFGLQHLLESSQNIYVQVISVIVIFLLVALVPLIFVLSRRYYLSRGSLRGIHFSFRGKISKFYRIVINGAFLFVITFGFYIPYFRNNIKRFFIENSFFGNKNFTYSGEGKEVFKKFVTVFVLYTTIATFIIFFVIYLIAFLLEQVVGGNIKSIVLPIAFVACYLSIYLLFFWFEFWFTKYIWNHTSFMDANFKLDIKFLSYLKLKTVNLLIYLFTVGFGWPWVAVRNSKFLTDRLLLEGNVDFASVKQEFIKASATGESVADIFDLDAGIDLGI